MMQCGAGREISDNLEASARLQKGWQMDFITCQLRKKLLMYCMRWSPRPCPGSVSSAVID